MTEISRCSATVRLRWWHTRFRYTMSFKHFLSHGRHVPFLLVIQIAFIIIFAFTVEYGDSSDSHKAFGKKSANEGNELQHYYPSNYFFLLVWLALIVRLFFALSSLCVLWKEVWFKAKHGHLETQIRNWSNGKWKFLGADAWLLVYLIYSVCHAADDASRISGIRLYQMTLCK